MALDLIEEDLKEFHRMWQAFSRWRRHERSTAKSREAVCFTKEAMDLESQTGSEKECLALSTRQSVYFVDS